ARGGARSGGWSEGGEVLIDGHKFPESAERAVEARVRAGPATLFELSIVAENAGCHPDASYRGVDRLMQKHRKSGRFVFNKGIRDWTVPADESATHRAEGEGR